MTSSGSILAEGKRVLINAPGRFDGVTAIGVDEHVWRHTRRGDKYVTVKAVAMDGFTGFKTATAEELADAIGVMDPFHVVRLAGDALDRCRRRVQQAIHGHRGHQNDQLYSARRTLHTGADVLTDKQKDRLTDLFATDAHVEVEVEVEVEAI